MGVNISNPVRKFLEKNSKISKILNPGDKNSTRKKPNSRNFVNPFSVESPLTPTLVGSLCDDHSLLNSFREKFNKKSSYQACLRAFFVKYS